MLFVNSYGIEVIGLIVVEVNNGVCIVGVVYVLIIIGIWIKYELVFYVNYLVKLCFCRFVFFFVGVRLIVKDWLIIDIIWVKVFSYYLSRVDIYLNSWGFLSGV